jgi:hypothetical protein
VALRLAHGYSLSIRGKRGQKFFRNLVAALEAMPQKRLIAEAIDVPYGTAERDPWRNPKNPSAPYLIPRERCGVCALGALARARGINLRGVDPEATGYIAKKLGIADMLAREVTWENDEHYS